MRDRMALSSAPAMLLIALPATLVRDPDTLLSSLGRVGLTILVAFVLQRLAFLVVGRAEKLLVQAAHGHPAARQRARTLGQTARHLITTIVAGGAVLHVLGVFGWDVKPLLVGASILGAGLAFGAQTLVRDIIAGAAILVEDQFSVGDAIEVAGTVATVEELTLRATRLRDFQGRLLFVPNGEMKIVINHSRDWHRSLIDLPIAANQDLARALNAASSAVASVAANPEIQPSLLEPPQVIGLERVGGDGVVLRIAVRTGPGAPAAVAARETRRVALETLLRAGVRTHSNEARIAPAPEVGSLSPEGAPPAGPAPDA
jgi:small conductance mechanosensitive channel